MSRIPRTLAVLASLTALFAARPARATRVKDLTDVVGVRENAIYGYGLVVGLAGTGDTQQVLFTQQSVAGMLGRLGIRIAPTDVRSRNVAAVMVTANLPPFPRPGSRIDVTVGSMGDARSLAGGVLLITALTAGDGEVYALAQGAVQVGGFDASLPGATFRKNTPTSGRVPEGATVERAGEGGLPSGPLTLALRHADVTTATRIAAAVNQKVGEGTAKAIDPSGVEVKVPDARKADIVGFLADIEDLDVLADVPAKVVVSERTGTVVAGERVRIRPVAVAHGALSVRIQRTSNVSQPMPYSQGRTVQAFQDQVSANEQPANVVALPATATVEELVKALNALGASPRDLVAILQAVKAAGALDAEIEVLE